MSVYDDGCELGGMGRGCRCKVHKITLKTLVEDMEGYIAFAFLVKFLYIDIFKDKFLLYHANINL